MTGRLAGLALTITCSVAMSTACSSGDEAAAPRVAANLTIEGVVVARADQSEIPFGGTLRCRGAGHHATGDLVDRAARACRRLGSDRKAFDGIARRGRVCAQIYGGPQRATVRGTVGGRPVDITVTRTDSCGVDDWHRLEWLLGSPER